MAESQYWVYVLRNPEGKFYIGLTEDLARRLEQHNSGISTWTKTRGPWDLVWRRGPMKLGNARKLEHQLKRQKRGTGFYRITGLQTALSSGS